MGLETYQHEHPVRYKPYTCGDSRLDLWKEFEQQLIVSNRQLWLGSVSFEHIWQHEMRSDPLRAGLVYGLVYSFSRLLPAHCTLTSDL